jgi:DeoR/GlpR family transcriptional regulator of sugar metabolism/ABC-type sugar transport system substrate-binding protein
MAADDRLEQITLLIDERGFLSVRDLSEHFQVSEMTIRRDLQRLDEEGRLNRTYGGAASLKRMAAPGTEAEQSGPFETVDELLANRVDVIITSSLEQSVDYLLLDRATKMNIPIIAESASLEKQVTVVAVDNYKAAFELGKWAGLEFGKKWNGQLHVLDLSYSLPNTQVRSRAFMAGIHDVCSQASLVLSINAQSSSDISYQLTRDALTVHSQVNLIFAINDATAWGAIQACRDLGLDPEKITVIPFGLEGDTMRNLLAEGTFCKAGLAMFPEIVAPACIEAAIAAYAQVPLPAHLVTPYTIVTNKSLAEIYSHAAGKWIPRWDVIYERFSIPIDIHPSIDRSPDLLPRRIGFIVPFGKHDWYRNLVLFMLEHAKTYNIELEIVDAEKEVIEEIEARRRAIALLASEQVQSGEVVIIDGGPIAGYLAKDLLGKSDLTVITNSTMVLNTLEQDPQIQLISTGGALRRSSQVFVGPTAESALRELRADKLFLSVSGISQDFGLSHTNISEVTIKQAMIHSAREVILLADYTIFGQESVAQVAGLKIVNKLIADESLPAKTRLDLAKLGIKVQLASL